MHTAIIMDGNGRWATEKGLGRSEGHRAGADAVRRTVEAAPGLGIDVLTLYAFSGDNWRRPPAEVEVLMALFGRFLDAESDRCRENGVRLEVIGRRDRLSPTLCRKVARAETRTMNGSALLLRIAIDYSARDAIVSASSRAPRSRDDFDQALRHAIHARSVSGDVDLLIRTGRERRLSDFLLWECAYAELHFTDVLWPDFTAADLSSALEQFAHRERRFGAVTAQREEMSCTTSSS
jgi:undecaprenyl diphosphate synthase